MGSFIPGAVFLVGLLFYFPALNTLMAKDGVTLGQFGIFLLLAYAAGHLLAAVGNALEAALWRLAGGHAFGLGHAKRTAPRCSPAHRLMRLRQKRARVLAAHRHISAWPERHGSPFPATDADVMKNGKPDRIDTFNGNYGLNRGLAASMLGLAAISLLQGQRAFALGFIVLACVYGYRAYRFGRHYARELYLQFLVLSDVPAPKT